MTKLSIRHKYAHKLSKRDYDSIIHTMKEKVKKDPAVKKKFQEYNVPLNDIDKVHVEFTKLPVSAKTKNMKIYLNVAMLDENSDVKDPSSYLAHELVHYLQQITGNVEGHNAVDEYLDKPTEIESFNVQYDYKENNEGKEEADEYIEDLLSYHNVSNEDKDDKIKELKGEK